MRTFPYLSAALALMVAILACNFPSSQQPQQGASAILTAAALTVQAQLPSATPALAPTSTFTPIPSSLPTLPPPTLPPPTLPPPTATQACDLAQFIADVTVPDGTTFSPGEHFVKTWRLKNIGTCSWTPSYAVVFSSGEQMGGPSAQALAGNVNPGQTVDLSVSLTAPSSNGDYTGYWKLRNAAGTTFAQFYVQIHVAGGGGGPFAVIHVETAVNPPSYSGDCSDPGGKHIQFVFTAQITTNGAGTVTYRWERSDSASAPTQTLTFGAAGTQTVTATWDRWFVPGDNKTGWERVYVDNPNHQYFSKATFTVTCNP